MTVGWQPGGSVDSPRTAGQPSRTADVLGRLVDRSHGVPPQGVPALVAQELGAVGYSDVELRLRSFDQKELVVLDHRDGSGDRPRRVPVEGSLQGRAYSTSWSLEQDLGDGRVRLHQPMLDGTDRVGVVSVTLAATRLDDEVRTALRQIAGLVADLVVTKNAYTDAYVSARSTAAMTLPAQLQWQLLPPLALKTALVEVGGALEPAYDIGGDSFDYALNDEVLHICALDAMGHGLEAATMATLVVAAYRHARRAGADLPGLYEAADLAMDQLFGPEKFVTAQMARLDTRTGLLRWVNAGHPPPLLLRGRTVVRALERPTTLPIGLGGDAPQVHSEQLEPGDAVLFHTDGVTDHRLPDGSFFGESRFHDLLEQVAASEQRAEELVRRLSHRLLEARGGETTDDVTLLLVRWPGSWEQAHGEPRARGVGGRGGRGRLTRVIPLRAGTRRAPRARTAAAAPTWPAAASAARRAAASRPAPARACSSGPSPAPPAGSRRAAARRRRCPRGRGAPGRAGARAPAPRRAARRPPGSRPTAPWTP